MYMYLYNYLHIIIFNLYLLYKFSPADFLSLLHVFACLFIDIHILLPSCNHYYCFYVKTLV